MDGWKEGGRQGERKEGMTDRIAEGINMEEWTGERKDGRGLGMGRWMDERVIGWIGVRNCECIEGWMDG